MGKWSGELQDLQSPPLSSPPRYLFCSVHLFHCQLKEEWWRWVAEQRWGPPAVCYLRHHLSLINGLVLTRPTPCLLSFCLDSILMMDSISVSAFQLVTTGDISEHIFPPNLHIRISHYRICLYPVTLSPSLDFVKMKIMVDLFPPHPISHTLPE